jgi:predicted ATP-dependent endonuclease of OLD family
MPVLYRFSRLEIGSFRGIRELTIEIPQKVPVHLIGANNAGKSTVMQAVAFALNGGGFHKHTTEPFDFFHDSQSQRSDAFSITLHLEADDSKHLPAVQGAAPKPIPVHALRVLGRVKSDGTLEHQNVLIGDDAEAITLSPSLRSGAMTKGRTKTTASGGGRGMRGQSTFVVTFRKFGF